jgi:hypothetical protein
MPRSSRGGLIVGDLAWPRMVVAAAVFVAAAGAVDRRVFPNEPGTGSSLTAAGGADADGSGGGSGASTSESRVQGADSINPEALDPQLGHPQTRRPLMRQACEGLTAWSQLGATGLGTRPDNPLMQREHCSLCDIIVHNSRRWSATDDASSLGIQRLCNGVPPHALDWCEYYACQLFLFCPYFYQRHAPGNRGAPCNVSQASVCHVRLGESVLP